MQILSNKVILVIFSLLLIICFLLLLLRQTETSRFRDSKANVKTYKNLITENVKVVDAESGKTLFWYNEDGAIQAVKIEKANSARWIITVEDITQSTTE